MTEQTGFLHNVYFWVGDLAGPNAAHDLAQGCEKYLRGIPGVLRMIVGYPAGTDRVVVDNSFAVSLFIEFADRAAHEIYQEHPDHLKFIAECNHLWRRVQVFDSLPCAG